MTLGWDPLTLGELPGRAEVTAALEWRGVCFHPDRVPERSRAPRMRSQPFFASPALQA